MRVGVIGAGAWGTTLALLLAEKGFQVHLWTLRPSLCEMLICQRENALYLPGVELPLAIKPTSSLGEAASTKDLVFLAVPSHAYRQVLERLAPFFHPSSLLVSATKGIELPKGLMMSQIAREVLPSLPQPASGSTTSGWTLRGRPLRLAVLSGPSFAKEVSHKLPTAVVAASDEIEVASLVQEALSTPLFRVYVSLDPLGVEVGGALKNVIAIAAGVADGLRLGHNARAALIARGLAEMARLGVAMGAKAQTFAGLAGIGDLVLTATSDLSRNRQVGLMLAKGMRLSEILTALGSVAEGVNAAKAALSLADRYRVEMPICRQVHATLFEGKEPWKALEALLARDMKLEEGCRYDC